MLDDLAERVHELSVRWHVAYHKMVPWESCTAITCQADHELYYRYLGTYDTIFWCGIGKHYKDTPQHKFGCKD